MSPSDLASWRSNAVSSGASSARFRRPPVTCLRMQASTSRSVAWPVAWNDRPIKSDAVVAVSRGAPGSEPRGRSAADPRCTVRSRSRHESWSARSCSSKRPASSAARGHAPAKSAIQRLMSARASSEMGRALVARPREPASVVARPRGQDQRDRSGVGPLSIITGPPGGASSDCHSQSVEGCTARIRIVSAPGGPTRVRCARSHRRTDGSSRTVRGQWRPARWQHMCPCGSRRRASGGPEAAQRRRGSTGASSFFG